MVGANVDEQTDLLTDALWRSVDDRSSGVARLDSILGKTGLGGGASAPVTEITRELAEVRHCVVHRGGFVDRRLLEMCPWLTLGPRSRARYA
jgi:hypothetical protein